MHFNKMFDTAVGSLAVTWLCTVASMIWIHDTNSRHVISGLFESLVLGFIIASFYYVILKSLVYPGWFNWFIHDGVLDGVEVPEWKITENRVKK